MPQLGEPHDVELLEEGSSGKEPKEIPLSEYNPVMLEKDDLKKFIVILFNLDPEELSPQQIGSILTEDKLIVREKYSLPDEQIWINQPDEYYHQLELTAQQTGVPIRNKKDYERFFKEHLATGVYLRSEDIIAVEELLDLDDSSRVSSKSLMLEHELIHAIQARRYPRMSKIRREYEAHLVHANEETFRTQPWIFIERIALSLTPAELKDAWLKYQHENM